MQCKCELLGRVRESGVFGEEGLSEEMSLEEVVEDGGERPGSDSTITERQMRKSLN